MKSILNTIKDSLGVDEDDHSFDTDIIIHINSTFSMLRQMGVGPINGFRINDAETLWSEFLEDQTRVDMIADYMYMKVKLLFDPPTSSAAIESLKQCIKEYEWRIYTDADK